MRPGAARRVVWGLGAALLAATGCSESHGQDAPDASLGEPWEVPRGAHLQAQYRGEPSHQGLAPEGARLLPPLERAWVSEPLAIGRYSASKSSPAVDETRLYVGMDDGVLYALERSDGAIAWTFATERAAHEAAAPGPDHYGIHASPAFDAERVYVGDYDGFVYALARDDGALDWQRDLGGSIGASPVLHEGVLYIAVEFGAPRDAKLFGLDCRDGRVVMQSGFLGEQAHATPTLDVAHGLVMVGDNAGVLHALDVHSGRERWRHVAGAPIKSTAALADGSVYVTSWDRHLYALDAGSGRERFRYRTRGPSMSSPSVFDGRVWFGSYDQHVYALDAASGARHVAFDTAGDVQSSPTVVAASALVAVGSRSGFVYLLDARDGALVQALELGEAVTSVPVVVDGELYVSDDAGRVHRFDSAP